MKYRYKPTGQIMVTDCIISSPDWVEISTRPAAAPTSSQYAPLNINMDAQDPGELPVKKRGTRKKG